MKKLTFLLFLTFIVTFLEACAPTGKNAVKTSKGSVPDMGKDFETENIPVQSEIERLQSHVADISEKREEYIKNHQENSQTAHIKRAKTKRRKYDEEEEDESPVVRKSRRLCKKLVPAIVCNYLISDNVFIYILDTLLMFF